MESKEMAALTLASMAAFLSVCEGVERESKSANYRWRNRSKAGALRRARNKAARASRLRNR